MLRLPDKPENLVVYIVGVLTILSFCWTTLCTLWKCITKCRFRFVFASIGDSRGNRALCIQTKNVGRDMGTVSEASMVYRDYIVGTPQPIPLDIIVSLTIERPTVFGNEQTTLWASPTDTAAMKSLPIRTISLRTATGEYFRASRYFCEEVQAVLDGKAHIAQPFRKALRSILWH